MPKITIDVDKFTKITKKDIVMQYLFPKSGGARRKSEVTTQEMYRGWTEACLKLGTHPGKAKDFGRVLWVMGTEGIVEISRTEPCGKKIDRNYYILTEEYFAFMRQGGKST